MQRTIFTDEHDLFRDAFRQFVEKEIVPGFLQWEEEGIVPRELFAKAGAAGFLGMDVPEELSAFKFARQKSKLAGEIRGSYFVIKGEHKPTF